MLRFPPPPPLNSNQGPTHRSSSFLLYALEQHCQETILWGLHANTSNSHNKNFCSVFQFTYFLITYVDAAKQRNSILLAKAKVSMDVSYLFGLLTFSLTFKSTNQEHKVKPKYSGVLTCKSVVKILTMNNSCQCS